MDEDKNKSIYKLNGFPTIYYNNLDDDISRREYMEDQFKYWGIKNYHRTSGYDGRKSDLSEILVGKYPEQMNSRDVVMEDDCDMSTIKYWPFVWKDFIAKLPPDWDIIQLAVINPISVHLKIHRTYVCDYSSACYMIKRHYAKKLVDIYCRKDKYKLDWNIKPRCCSEHIKYQGGKSLTMPLFLYNETYPSSIHSPEHIQTFHMSSHDSLWSFWKNKASDVDWNDLFTYDPVNHQGVPPEAMKEQNSVEPIQSETYS